MKGLFGLIVEDKIQPVTVGKSQRQELGWLVTSYPQSKKTDR